MSVKQLALSLPKHAWRTITWREGTNERLSSRFARVRVRTAPIRRASERAEETLLIEWPEGESQSPPSTGSPRLTRTSHSDPLVNFAKMRWRIERDYQGPQTRNWARALRGARMAGLPSSWHIMHRSLRIPDLQTGGTDVPPRDLVSPGDSRNLCFPVVTDPAAPPIRPQRHVPDSIARDRSISS